MNLNHTGVVPSQRETSVCSNPFCERTMAKRKRASDSVGQKVFCPCCPKWEIKYPERCSNTAYYQGRIFYFCTRRCRERFQKTPEKFASDRS